MNLTKMLELTIAGREDTSKLLMLEDMIKGLINQQEASKKGNLSLFKQVEKYIKTFVKVEPNKTNFHGICIHYNNTYFTNTRSLFRINHVLEGFNEVKLPEAVYTMIDEARNNNRIEVDIPVLSELKAIQKTAKAAQKAGKHKSILTIEEANFKIHNSYVDIELLIEVLEVLGNNVSMLANEKKNSLVYFKGDNGEAILLPLNRRD